MFVCAPVHGGVMLTADPSSSSFKGAGGVSLEPVFLQAYSISKTVSPGAGEPSSKSGLLLLLVLLLVVAICFLLFSFVVPSFYVS